MIYFPPCCGRNEMYGVEPDISVSQPILSTDIGLSQIYICTVCIIPAYVLSNMHQCEVFFN